MPRTPAQAKIWREENKELLAARHKAWRARNKEALFAQKKAWREANKEHVKEKLRQWSEQNQHRWRGYHASRRAAKKNATPSWADFEAIDKFYEEAETLTALLGEPYQVDHIVPLQSPLVCGLHNQFNLQVLPASENRSKSNRFWPDMP